MPATRIYLTGFMGSGKSAAGPHVARVLGYRFRDVDRLIERRTGLAIAALFAERGEEAFRRLERETVREMCRQSRVVVSLGGGAVADPGTRALLLETGTLVWLRVSPETVAARLVRSAARRPMLHGPDGRVLEGEALLERIRALMEARAEAYAAAHVTVDADSASARETAQRVVRALGA